MGKIGTSSKEAFTEEVETKSKTAFLDEFLGSTARKWKFWGCVNDE
jgi:hypothetical protein